MEIQIAVGLLLILVADCVSLRDNGIDVYTDDMSDGPRDVHDSYHSQSITTDVHQPPVFPGYAPEQHILPRPQTATSSLILPMTGAMPTYAKPGAVMPNNVMLGNRIPSNGMLGNGMLGSGIHDNGLPSNGMLSNGIPSNGILSNGMPGNGIHSNGMSIVHPFTNVGHHFLTRPQSFVAGEHGGLFHLPHVVNSGQQPEQIHTSPPSGQSLMSPPHRGISIIAENIVINPRTIHVTMVTPTDVSSADLSRLSLNQPTDLLSILKQLHAFPSLTPLRPDPINVQYPLDNAQLTSHKELSVRPQASISGDNTSDHVDIGTDEPSTLPDNTGISNTLEQYHPLLSSINDGTDEKTASLKVIYN